MTIRPTMYQLLVEEGDDIFGALAYAAYKRHKLEVMDGIAATSGEAPTQRDIDVFYQSSSAPSMLEMYLQEGESMSNSFLSETLASRQSAFELQFTSTMVGQQLQAIQAKQNERASLKGWVANVSGNLAVNFVTILVIAAMLFGFRGLDKMLGEFGRNSGVLMHDAPDGAGQKAQQPAPPAGAAPNKPGG